MNESKPKICKMPRCDKSTFDNRAFFCREHEREFKDYLNDAGKEVGAVAVSAALFVAKVFGGKKK